MKALSHMSPLLKAVRDVHPLVVVGIILALLLALIFGLHWWKDSRGVGPEISRKLVHVIMGLVAASFPWVFTDVYPVLLVSTLSAIMLAALRWVPTLGRFSKGVLLDVDRDSLGELYFPAGIAITFWLTGGHEVIYPASVLCMTLADPAAALVGERRGKHVFRISKARKTLEGSAAFFVVSFVVIWAVLALGGLGRIGSLHAAVPAALAATGVEAASSGGKDNLLIPLITALLIALGSEGRWLEAELYMSMLGLVSAAMILRVPKPARRIGFNNPSNRFRLSDARTDHARRGRS